MDFTIHLFVGLHIIGIASLLGPVLHQVSSHTRIKAMAAGEARMVPAMLYGALTMLVTGMVLVGLNQADDQEVNNLKIGVKLAVLVVILALVYLKRDDATVSRGVFGAVGLLTVANIFLAVLWV